MPANFRTVEDAGTGFRAWYESVPVFTRTYVTGIVAMTLGLHFGLIKGSWIVYDFSVVIKKLEIWRLITNFFWIGKPSFKFLITLIWVLQYGKPLEEITYQFDQAGFLYMLMFNATMLLLGGSFLGRVVLGMPMVLSILYIWSKNFQDQNINLYGLINLKAFYLPFAMLALSVLMGGDIVEDIMGIVVGHMYYFLHDLYPVTIGNHPLRTPVWLTNWLAGYGIGRHAVNVTPSAGAGRPGARQEDPSAGFSAFRGRGQRLGGS